MIGCPGWIRAVVVHAVLMACLVFPVDVHAAATATTTAAWDPVAREDLELKDSVRNPGSDTEFLFWRVSLRVPFLSGLETQSYVRAKIYTRQGVENAGQLSFEVTRGEKLKSIAARVLKVDGTKIELQPADFIESELAKIGDFKVKRTAFAFPNLAPGDIVEYRWTIEKRGTDGDGWFFCQQPSPVREYVLEFASPKKPLLASWYNITRAEHTRVGDIGLRVVARNLPAYVEEPLQPPELDSRGWIRLEDSRLTRDWHLLGRAISEVFKEKTEPNAVVKKRATELVAGAVDREDKIRRLHEFCRLKIVNLEYTDEPAARAELDGRKPRDSQSPKKTLERGRGTSEDIDLLFAALLRGIGIAPHPVLFPSNAVVFRTRGRQQGWELFQEMCIGVSHGSAWAFYRPGQRLLPYGLPDRYAQGVSAFIATGGTSLFEVMPCAPAEESALVRKARFLIDGEGTLHGSVTETCTGHIAVGLRRKSADSSQETVDREYTEMIAKRIPGAEVTGIRWEHLRDYDGPIVVNYTVTVPGYAEITGQRLVFTASFFTRGDKDLFTAPERKNPLFWRGGWSEIDDIEFTLPPALEIEQATAPRGVKEENGLLLADYDLGYSTKRHTFAYQRKFTFDVKKGGQFFLREAYPIMKKLFDKVHAADAHSIVLRPKPTGNPKSADAPAAAASEAKPAGS